MPLQSSMQEYTLRHAGSWGDTTPVNNHDDVCYCGRPAKWHIVFGTGCGNVCGIHRRVIERRKGRFARVERLEA